MPSFFLMVGTASLCKSMRDQIWWNDSSLGKTACSSLQWWKKIKIYSSLYSRYGINSWLALRHYTNFHGTTKVKVLSYMWILNVIEKKPVKRQMGRARQDAQSWTKIYFSFSTFKKPAYSIFTSPQGGSFPTYRTKKWVQVVKNPPKQREQPFSATQKPGTGSLGEFSATLVE